MKIAISRKDLTEKVKSKLTAQELADYYHLPVDQMRKALREAGLKIIRKPRYEIVDDRFEGIITSSESGSKPLEDFSFEPLPDAIILH